MEILMYFMFLSFLCGMETKEGVEERNFPEDFSYDGSSETDFVDNESETLINSSPRGRSNLVRTV